MRRLAATLLIATIFLPADAAHAQSDDRQAVVAVVQRLFDAMRTRDTVLLRSVLDSSARLIAVPTAPAARARVTTPSQFIATIANGSAAEPLNERMFDPEVRIDGPVAQVWTYYTFHRGATFSHCGVDAFSLLRTPDGWKITNLIWSNRTDGCIHKDG